MHERSEKQKAQTKNKIHHEMKRNEKKNKGVAATFIFFESKNFLHIHQKQNTQA